MFFEPHFVKNSLIFFHKSKFVYCVNHSCFGIFSNVAHVDLFYLLLFWACFYIPSYLTIMYSLLYLQISYS